MINLLDDLQDEFQLSYVFVAHDLSVVRHVSDRIAVMYLGKLMEVSPAEELYNKPIHPYTSALLGAIPIPDPKENRARTRTRRHRRAARTRSGRRRAAASTRAARAATDICRTAEPPLTEYAGGHLAACHHPQNVTARGDRRQPSAPTPAPRAPARTCHSCGAATAGSRRRPRPPSNQT